MAAAITKRTFITAARMVSAIRAGEWMNDAPSWAPIRDIEVMTEADGNLDPNYIRAVWTAEFLILLFEESNPRFDRERFLVACGLVDKPARKPRRTIGG